MTAEDEKRLLDDVAEIRRGLFGDDKLQQKGLIKRVIIIEKWMTRANLKISYTTGAVVAVLFVAKGVLEFLTHK